MDDVFTIKKPREELTFADLRHHFGTGRAYIKSGSGRDRVYGYRRGIMTDIGDIEESEWKGLMLDLIQRSNEMDIYRKRRKVPAFRHGDISRQRFLKIELLFDSVLLIWYHNTGDNSWNEATNFAYIRLLLKRF